VGMVSRVGEVAANWCDSGMAKLTIRAVNTSRLPPGGIDQGLAKAGHRPCCEYTVYDKKQTAG